MTPPATSRWIRWFLDVGLSDVSSVGGKNASLGEMYRTLTGSGIRVPNGFAVTAEGYWHFIRRNALDQRIKRLLDPLDPKDILSLRETGKRIRHEIVSAELPSNLVQEILSAYSSLGAQLTQPIDVAVRSSATAEDLPQASFAGQLETYLNVQGSEPLLLACKRCFASLFTDRAISYRADMGFDAFRVGLSVGIQKMVRSDLASSGVMFSIDTETGFPNAVLINASFGLGENIVQGAVNPDEFMVFKPTLKQAFRPIIRRRLGTKEFKLVYDIGGGKMVKNLPVPPDDRKRFAITDREVLTLAHWACLIEDHYSQTRGHYTPMDMEWAKDGVSGELHIVQARPETVQSRKPPDQLETYRLKEKSSILATGRSVGEKIASGMARVITSVQDRASLQPGEVLVTDKTDPDWEPVMKRALAIVTNRGGRTCHAAIVSRELGLPAIVGTEIATEAISSGQEITISCAEGETGYVYDGKLGFDIERTPLRDMPKPATRVMMNVANPDEALRLSLLPNDGVGLARLEFIIGNTIGIHPLALVHPESVFDVQVRREIDKVTHGYPDQKEFFIEKLSEGVGTIAAAFYPRDVIVRLSDFKTNEYANLLGGSAFEPKEENPMLGFRGASRYSHPRYCEGFALECQAMKRVREEMGLTNLKLMIPFCRTPDEGRKVIQEIENHGLKQGVKGLEIYVMCEIPSNVLLAEEFARIFDGFSIGSNDLTQLILGVDRDSELVASIFDERSPAVKKMIAEVIQVAKARGRKIGICGQAPSDYPEFAQFLVEQGINSISLNPDSVLKTTLLIVEQEKRLGRDPK